jgi:hypothetical protein
MSKSYEIVGRNVLVTKRNGTSGSDKTIGIRLSSVTRWQEYLGEPALLTTVWFDDGGEAVIAVPFDEFTKIIAMTPIITASG